MKRMLGLFVSASLAFAGCAWGKEKSFVSVARTSEWQVSSDKNACHLTATFGEKNTSAIVRMTRYEPESELDLTIYGGAFQTFGNRLSTQVQFGSGQSIQRDAIAGKAGNNIPLLIISSLRLDGWKPKKPGQTGPVVSPEQEAQVKSIGVTLIETRHFQFETDSLARPMAAMRACTAELVSRWGYDPAQQLNLSKRPEPLKSPSSWFKDNDFPKGSLGRNGLVPFRLDINEAGEVVGCVVLLRTNPDDFADLTCALISKRARFRPALDRSGTPVRSYMVDKVNWLSF